MKRRTFLRMIGLAPVAAALPAMALPRPDNVKEAVKGDDGIDCDGLRKDANWMIGYVVGHDLSNYPNARKLMEYADGERIYRNGVLIA